MRCGPSAGALDEVVGGGDGVPDGKAGGAAHRRGEGRQLRALKEEGGEIGVEALHLSCQGHHAGFHQGKVHGGAEGHCLKAGDVLAAYHQDPAVTVALLQPAHLVDDGLQGTNVGVGGEDGHWPGGAVGGEEGGQEDEGGEEDGEVGEAPDQRLVVDHEAAVPGDPRDSLLLQPADSGDEGLLQPVVDVALLAEAEGEARHLLVEAAVGEGLGAGHVPQGSGVVMGKGQNSQDGREDDHGGLGAGGDWWGQERRGT